jgi:RHS repeat-associated protein
MLNRYSYQPFGERLTAAQQVDSPFQYVGRHGVMQEENGLAFMRARYFHLDTGRFTQRDPIGLAGGVNLYGYAGSSPTNASDPSGLVMDYALYWKLLVDEYVALHGGSSVIRNTIPFISNVFMEERMTQQLLKAGVNLTRLKEYAGWRLPRLPLSTPPIFQPPANPSGGGIIRHIAGRGWQAARPVLTNPYVLSFAAGVAIGTALRHYVPWIDDGAQRTWVDLNDRLGGWLFGTPPAAELGTPIVSSHDPNDLIGPAGNGTARWIAPDQVLPYKIRFENDKQATAPAQVVRITEQLDPGLDYTTFELGSFNFDGVTVTVPAGLTFYSERLDLRATHGLYLDITANLDLDTGIVTWEFTSIDPVTGRTPRDPFSGFLPPNVTSPIGEGYVTYTIRPLSSSGIGTPIVAQARIVFDTNEPIDTPVHRNPVGPIPDCTGDCDASLQVTVNELLAMVNIALGNVNPAACIAGDLNLDGTVTVDEIIMGVTFAVNGCPVPVVPTPTPSATVTVAVPSPSPTRTPTAAVTASASATPTATATPTPIEAQPSPSLTPLF